jgi:Ca-activated chloride channel family protein
MDSAMATLIRLLLLVATLGTAGCTPTLDWLLTHDQQGRLWLEQGQPLRAARAFDDPLLKGFAYYASEDFVRAAIVLSSIESARGRFQYGNALARQERLPDAIAAYAAALAMRPDFPEAKFNRDWVQDLLALDEKRYEDAGGTGGKLEADKIVFDEEGAEGKGEMTNQEAQAQGLSDMEIREMWMRRVQTTPGDFLRLKFADQSARMRSDLSE